MLSPRMTELNYNEILMYLGHRGQQVTPEVQEQILAAIAEVKANVSPRLVYTRLPLVEHALPQLPLEGKDMESLFSTCQEAVLMAVTLGAKIEQAMMRREVRNMADALIMDACASVAVENVCDCFEEDLRRQLANEGLYLSSRFSPGYGDLPLDTQPRLCAVLNTGRRIGLNVTENYLMVPRKSVTAVLGISKAPLTLRKKGCEVCSMFMTCPYRKRGLFCE